MKSSHSSILIFGHDEHLLMTRQWVLQSRGYRVLTAVDLEKIDSVARVPPVNLLLLCHSLQREEIAAAVIRARARWPGILTLELGAADSRAPAGFLGQLLHTVDGPERLVSMVDKLVGGSIPQRQQAAS